jgi:hypothetical protein
MRRLTIAATLIMAASAAPAAADPVVLGPGVQPAVTVDRDGTAYVAWRGPEGNFSSLQFCRLPRGAAACDVRRAIPVPGGESVARPFVHVDGANVHVVQHRYGIEGARFDELLLFTSLDGGATFAYGRSIGGRGFSDAAIGPGDALSIVGEHGFLAYQRQPLDGAPQATTRAALSPSHVYHGAIANFEQRPVIVAADLGSRGRVWRWTGQGDPHLAGNWSAQDIGHLEYPRLAAGPLGLFMLAEGEADALEIRRFDGTTFAAGLRLATHAGWTDLAQDAGGRLHAFWYIASSDDLRIRYAISDDGVTWESGEQRIDTEPFGNQPDAAIAPDHMGVIAWEVGRVVKALAVGPGPPAEATPTPQPTPAPTPVTPPPPPPPKAGLPAARDLQASARRRGSRVSVSLSGRVKMPAGAACGGKLVVFLRAGKRQLHKSSAKVDGRCAFTKQLRVPAAKLRRISRIAVRLRFLGTQKTYLIRIRR